MRFTAFFAMKDESELILLIFCFKKSQTNLFLIKHYIVLMRFTAFFAMTDESGLILLVFVTFTSNLFGL